VTKVEFTEFLAELITEVKELDTVDEVIDLLNERLDADIEDIGIQKELKFRESLSRENEDPDYESELESIEKDFENDF